MSSFCGGCGGTADGRSKRQLSLPLVAGIVFVPFILVWALFRSGYPNWMRAGGIVSLFVAIGIAAKPDDGKEVVGDGAAVGAEQMPSAGDNESTKPTPEAPKSTARAKTRTEAEAPAENKGGEFAEEGMPVQLGDFSYSVNNVTARRRIGTQYINEQASQGATFVVVRFTIENLAKSTKTIMTDDFKTTTRWGVNSGPVRGQEPPLP